MLKFNNYSLSNEEIEKIIKDFYNEIKKASRINGKYDDECEQKIIVEIFKKLSKNRKK